MTRSADISPLSVLLSRVDAVADGSASRDTVPCGFPSLDKMLGGGFRRGDLIVLGGCAGWWVAASLREAGQRVSVRFSLPVVSEIACARDSDRPPKPVAIDDEAVC